MTQRRLLELARSAPAPLAAAIGSGWLAAALAIAQAWCLSQAIDGAFLKHNGLAAVSGWLLVATGLIVARGIAVSVAEFSSAAGSRRIRSDLRVALARSLMRRGLSFETSTSSGELAQTLTDGVDALDAFFNHYLPQIAQTALIPLTIWLVIVGQDPLTAIILAITAPLVPIFMVLIGYTAQALTRRQFNLLGRLGGHFLDLLQGLTTLKLLGRGAAQAAVLARYNERYRSATLDVLRLAFLSALVLELLTTISTAVVAVEIGLRLLHGDLAFQTALFALMLTPDFFLPLRMLGQRYHAAASGLAAAERIFALMDAPAPALIVNDAPEDGGLRVSAVSVVYPNGHHAIEDVSFMAPPGAIVAVIGLNGSGKSTLLRAIAGLQAPTSGGLGFKTGGRLAQAPTGWPHQIAYLPQRPHLFADTIAGNITLARPQATSAEINAAVEATGLGGFLSHLPAGLETPVSELGRNLSGGQAQRIALARVCLQAAPLVVLDEPEQALDALLTARLVSLLRAWRGSRTVVLAAHRRALAEQADLVLVLDHGRMVRCGPPDAVLPDCPWLDDRMVPLEAETGVGPATSDKTPSEQPPSVNTRKALSGLLKLARGEWRRMGLALVCATLTVASNAALMTTSAYLIAAAALQPALAALNLAIVGTRAFGLARGVLRYLERLTAHDVSLRLLARLRLWFYTSFEPRWPSRVGDVHSGDLVARAVADVDTLQDVFVRLLAPPAAAALMALTGAAILGAVDLSLAAMALTGALLVGLVLTLWVARRSTGAGAGLIAARAALQRAIIEGVQGQADLLASGRAETWIQDVAATQRKGEDAQRRLAGVSAAQTGLTVAATHLTVVAVLARGIALVEAGGLDPVWLAPIALGTLAAFEAFAALPPAATTMGAIVAAARRVFEVLGPVASREPALPGVERPGPPSAASSEGGLVVHDLTFTYPGQSRPTLDSISLRIRPGERMALVGLSGSGKSTLAMVLARLWEPAADTVFLSGVDITTMPIDELRGRIAVLEQNPHVFNASIRDNLLLADPSATAETLWSLLARVGLTEFVAGLPQGLDTPIGERGLGLSGGQRQRLALARTLLRPGELLIADEPIAHLDPATADLTLAELFAAAKGRCLLVISHDRLGTDDFDSVVHLQAGRVQAAWNRPTATGGWRSLRIDH